MPGRGGRVEIQDTETETAAAREQPGPRLPFHAAASRCFAHQRQSLFLTGQSKHARLPAVAPSLTNPPPKPAAHFGQSGMVKDANQHVSTRPDDMRQRDHHGAIVSAIAVICRRRRCLRMTFAFFVRENWTRMRHRVHWAGVVPRCASCLVAPSSSPSAAASISGSGAFQNTLVKGRPDNLRDARFSAQRSLMKPTPLYQRLPKLSKQRVLVAPLVRSACPRPIAIKVGHAGNLGRLRPWWGSSSQETSTELGYDTVR